MGQGKSRDPKKESFWRRMVRGQAGSGQSVRAWCHRHGLQEATFYRWRAELARRDAERPAFVPVHVTDDAPGEREAPIEISLGSGRLVRLRGPVDRQMLAEVVAVLTAGCVQPEVPRC
jgi:transposase-like protein